MKRVLIGVALSLVLVAISLTWPEPQSGSDPASAPTPGAGRNTEESELANSEPTLSKPVPESASVRDPMNHLVGASEGHKAKQWLRCGARRPHCADCALQIPIGAKQARESRRSDGCTPTLGRVRVGNLGRAR